MNEFLTVLTAVLPVFGIMGIGLLLRRRGWLSADADASLMRVTINLLLPCLIFASVLGNAALRRPENLLLPPLVGFGMVALGITISRLFARVAGLQMKPEQRTFAFLTGLQNYAYLVIPLCVSLFDAGTTGVLFVHNVGTEIAMWTLGVTVLTGSGLSGGWKKILNAPLAALLLALALNFLGMVWMPPAPSTSPCSACPRPEGTSSTPSSSWSSSSSSSPAPPPLLPPPAATPLPLQPAAAVRTARASLTVACAPC